MRYPRNFRRSNPATFSNTTNEGLRIRTASGTVFASALFLSSSFPPLFAALKPKYQQGISDNWGDLGMEVLSAAPSGASSRVAVSFHLVNLPKNL